MAEVTKKTLRIEVLEQMLALVTTGLGLVAALAWNSAIQDLFAFLFPDRQNLVAKFLYAVLITALVVIITTKLKKLITKLEA